MKKWTVVFLCLLMLFPAGVYLFAARTSGDEEGMRGAEEFFKARENTNPPAENTGSHMWISIPIRPPGRCCIT